MNKICTTIEQSKKLIELGIDVNTADMFWADGERPAVWNNKDTSLDEMDIPAWSLAALLDILKNRAYSIDDANVILSSYRTVEWWDLSINNSGLETVTKSDLIDACYEMIVKLKEKFVMKSYTDLGQSKKLAEILPIESADGFYESQYNSSTDTWETLLFIGNKWASPEVVIPCWGLASLLEILPGEITDSNGYKVYIDIRKYDSKYQIAYYTGLNWSDTITTDEYENLVDAAVEMIFTLKERNLL